MSHIKPKIIVVAGPTASGKSELAIVLAKRFGGEIISADSRQVYRGLDIGTGKVPGKWVHQHNPTSKRSLASWITSKKSKLKGKVFVYKGIPHYCIDFVPPRKVFSAADFKRCAEKAIADITARGKVPIIAGGTGFYIDAVVEGISLPQVAPDKKLRRKLGAKTNSELFALLKKLDSMRAKNIDSRNPRRLIRAIEIAKALGRVPKFKRERLYRVLWLGIKLTPGLLRKRIHARLVKRMNEGMAGEARRLRKSGLGWNRFYSLGLEYRHLADYIHGKVTKEVMCQNLETAIRHYARRQMVWFKKNHKVRWVADKKEAERLSRKFLSLTDDKLSRK